MRGFTPIRRATFAKLQFDAGVYLKNFDYSSCKSVQELRSAVVEAIEDGTNIIGATRGGGSFEATPTFRQIEADGLRGPVVGSTRNDMWVVKMRGTMLEITAENFALALAMAEVTSNGNIKNVKVHTEIQDEDYITSLCWVGQTAYGAMLINITNALNVNSATFTFTDKGEGTLPFEFQAHAEGFDEDYAPFEMLFLEEEAA